MPPSRLRARYHRSEMQTPEPISDELDQIARSVVDCVFAVHKEVGPGLLESVYHACFCEELEYRGISFRTQVFYRSNIGLRASIVVCDWTCLSAIRLLSS